VSVLPCRVRVIDCSSFSSSSVSERFRFVEALARDIIQDTMQHDCQDAQSLIMDLLTYA
jgi:hypothetical protein